MPAQNVAIEIASSQDLDRHFRSKTRHDWKDRDAQIPGAFIVLAKGEPATGNPLVKSPGNLGKGSGSNPRQADGGRNSDSSESPVYRLTERATSGIHRRSNPDAPAAHHIHYFVASQEDAMKARAWYVKTFGAAENARRNGAVPSALLTTPDKWLSVDFTAAGGRGRGAVTPAARMD